MEFQREKVCQSFLRTNSLTPSLTNEQRGEGSLHLGARQHDDGHHVAREAEERDGHQEDARRHELEHLELESEIIKVIKKSSSGR